MLGKSSFISLPEYSLLGIEVETNQMRWTYQDSGIGGKHHQFVHSHQILRLLQSNLEIIYRTSDSVQVVWHGNSPEFVVAHQPVL